MGRKSERLEGYASVRSNNLTGSCQSVKSSERMPSPEVRERHNPLISRPLSLPVESKELNGLRSQDEPKSQARRKKRPAPKPPVERGTETNGGEKESTARVADWRPEVDSSDRGNGLVTNGQMQTATGTHSRENSDSSGYHESPLIPHSPLPQRTTEAEAERERERPISDVDVCSEPGTSGAASSSGGEYWSLEKRSGRQAHSAAAARPCRECAVTECECASRGAKKHRAPPPPPPPPPIMPDSSGIWSECCLLAPLS